MRSRHLDFAVYAGAALLGLMVAAVLFVRLHLCSGLPEDELSWSLVFLVAGYLLYSFARSSAVTLFFSLVCYFCGAALIRFYGQTMLPGGVLLVLACAVLYSELAGGR